MTAILLVKTSSLGDVVHNLPVVTDIRVRFPEARIDWVVEESFAAIPRCHPGVREIIPVAVRRWRRSWWRRETRVAIGNVRARLAAQPYDAVIDTQGLLKSAWLAHAARGRRHGLDWASSREPLAWFYDRTHAVPWTLHAVERNRELAAQALGYARDGAAEYGVHGVQPQAATPYVVLLHATSAKRKLWPEAAWIALAQALAARGLESVLPWGNAEERARSERLAQAMARARVPDRMTLEAVAGLLGGARLVVGLDTGLTHFAGALGVPTVGIYVATDPAATGLYACPRGRNLGTIGRAPAVDEVVSAATALLAP